MVSEVGLAVPYHLSVYYVVLFRLFSSRLVLFRLISPRLILSWLLFKNEGEWVNALCSYVIGSFGVGRMMMMMMETGENEKNGMEERKERKEKWRVAHTRDRQTSNIPKNEWKAAECRGSYVYMCDVLRPSLVRGLELGLGDFAWASGLGSEQKKWGQRSGSTCNWNPLYLH